MIPSCSSMPFDFQRMDPTGVKVLETAEDIQERRQQVLDRYHRFKELSTLRRQKLEDSYRFQFFQRDADELEKWIQEKLQIASDENYKDPSNLQVKGTFLGATGGGADEADERRAG